jgi:hypothetical protein
VQPGEIAVNPGSLLRKEALHFIDPRRGPLEGPPRATPGLLLPAASLTEAAAAVRHEQMRGRY